MMQVNMNSLIRLVFSVGVYFSIIIPSSSLAYASIIELETFDTTITGFTLWDYLRTTGINFAVDGSKSYANFSGFNPTTFPYLRSIDLSSLPVNSVLIDARFSNINITQGSGIIITDNIPIEGHPLNFNSLLFYIWPKPNGSYHLFTPLCSVNNPECSSSSQLITGVVSIPSNIWQEINLRYVDSKYFFYLNNDLKFESEPTSRVIKTLAVGQPEIVRTSSVWSSYDINHIEISNIQNNDFPYYFQLDPLWADSEYNNASSWAPEEKEGINRWGCVITSSAMVFNSFGINTPADEQPTPATLNTWLSNEPDGYIRNGLVNWIALTRMARVSHSDGFAETKVEFTKESTFDVNNLEFPTILELPGHFLVSHNEDDLNLEINDPIDVDHKLLRKTEDILTVNTFTPSSSDLSYIMFVIDSQFDIELSDSSNNIFGTVYEEQLIDDVDGSSSTELLKILYYPKPEDGVYKVNITNPTKVDGMYDLDLYFYDDLANVKIPIDDFSYSLDAGDTDLFFFEYLKSDGLQEDIVSFSILQNIVWEFYQDGKIANKGIAKAIVRMTKYTEKFSVKSPWMSTKIINVLRKYIIRHTPRLISTVASESLIEKLSLIQF